MESGEANVPDGDLCTDILGFRLSIYPDSHELWKVSDILQLCTTNGISGQKQILIYTSQYNAL